MLCSGTTIVVFLEQEATESDVKDVEAEIKQMDNVDKYSFQSKQEVKKQEEKPIVQQEKEEIQPIITTQTQAEQITPIKAEVKQETKKTKKPYNIILISSIVLLASLFTFILVKAGKLKKLSHRKIWNVILLITFLVSCLLGFLLALQINYGFCMDWFRTFLTWHVEFGIAMTIIAVIHIEWHYKYYTTMISKKK